MEIKKQTLTISKTVRYFTSGNLSVKTKNVWVVCHGYGQLAENFIKKFDEIADEENYIIAPEGFHRYYLDEKHSRVGASWMTKEDRLDDIHDYVKMLDDIYEREIGDFSKKAEIKMILLGFSQGVATVSRWYKMGKIRPDVFVMWAGVFPPDLPLERELIPFEHSRNFVVIGNEDEFFNEERRESILSEIRNKGIKFEYIPFIGKHVLSPEILKELKNKI